MRIGDAIVEAVRSRDAELAGRIADALRFGHGLDYEETYILVVEAHRRRGVDAPSLASWDALLWEADRYDSGS